MSKFHFYSHNLALKQSLDRHVLREEYKEAYGDVLLLGPAWDSAKGEFVDEPLLVGIFRRGGSDRRSLEEALRIYDVQQTNPAYRCVQ